MKAPIAKKKRKNFALHGDKRVDDYFWMRDTKDPDLKPYLKAENKYSESWFRKHENVHQSILEELKARIRPQDSSVPYFYNKYWWGSDRLPGKEHPVLWRSRTKKGNKEIILDENKLAQRKKYSKVGGVTVSPDNTLMLFAHDTTANTTYDIYLRDLSSERTKRLIKNVSSNMVWSCDSQSFYFVKFDHAQRPYAVYRYDINTKTEELVFEELDELFYVSISRTTSDKYLIINAGGHNGNSQYLYDEERLSGPELVLKQKQKVEYHVDHTEEGFFLMSNQTHVDGILYFSTKLSHAIMEWDVFYKPKKGARMNDFSVHSLGVVISEAVDAQEHILIIPTQGKRYYLSLGDEPGSVHLGANKEYVTTSIRVHFESMTTPRQTIEHNLLSKKKKVLKTYTPQGGYKKDLYKSQKIVGISKDGTKIPTTLVYRKSMFKKDGTNPCLLYGYGSYGHSIFPYFSKDIISLLDRGFVYAIAHPRGGKELGEHWYQDAKFLNKKKTFHDFIACAEALIDQGFTAPETLCIRGGSAGGMLMGAVTNMRPDLFKAVVAQVPFVDVLNTMLDESIPLTVGEFVEWGNPKKKTYYKYMKSYSPYDNITGKDYPAMLVTAGFNDRQVHYWESAKYVAKLRAHKTDNNPLLLHMDMDSGHGGKNGRYKYLEDVARVFTFLLVMTNTDTL